MPVVDPMGSVAHLGAAGILSAQAKPIGDCDDATLTFLVLATPVKRSSSASRQVLRCCIPCGATILPWDRTLQASDWKPAKPSPKRMTEA
jgi:hypothetical protein